MLTSQWSYTLSAHYVRCTHYARYTLMCVVFTTDEQRARHHKCKFRKRISTSKFQVYTLEFSGGRRLNGTFARHQTASQGGQFAHKHTDKHTHTNIHRQAHIHRQTHAHSRRAANSTRPATRYSTAETRITRHSNYLRSYDITWDQSGRVACILIPQQTRGTSLHVIGRRALYGGVACVVISCCYWSPPVARRCCGWGVLCTTPPPGTAARTPLGEL